MAEIKDLPIIGPFNVQRFKQFGPEDSANWYVVKGDDSKKANAMYPVLGRKHINALGQNQFIFSVEPRQIFKTINFIYVVVGNQIYQYNQNYVVVNITSLLAPTLGLNTSNGPIYFAYLVVSSIIFGCFVDEQNIYIYREDNNTFVVVTDPFSPGVAAGTKPGYIATFGNRIVVSVANSSQFYLSQINLGGANFNAATCFHTANA